MGTSWMFSALHQLYSLLCGIFSTALRWTYLTMLPFVCLNGILFSVFLLKQLFFKPKFVENRQQTFTVVDPGGMANTAATSETDLVVQGNGTEKEKTQPKRLLGRLGAELPTTRSMMSRKIEQLYNTETFPDAAVVEYLTPYNPSQPIKFAEKLGAGFVGMIFKLQQTSTPAKCAKLVDVRTLLHIIEELNYVQGTLSAKMRLTALFRANTVGGSFMIKYLDAYHRFLDAARQLEIGPTGAENNKGRHPNVHYYEQVLVHHDPAIFGSSAIGASGGIRGEGNTLNPTPTLVSAAAASVSAATSGNNNSGEPPKKTFKRVTHVERQQLPSLVMLVMEQARLNLRSALIYEWYSLQTVSAAAEWGRQVASGLAYLHSVLGFPHLNVKAENVLLFPTEGEGSSQAQLPLHARFTAKISDCATAYLLPTVSRVLSQSHETSLWEVSPPGADKFALLEGVLQYSYDVHCFGMLVLLMLVGYEHYGRRYMLSMFPTGLLSPPRYRLLEIILADANAPISTSSVSSVDLPPPFVDFFKAVFGPGKEQVTMKQLLAMDAFKMGA